MASSPITYGLLGMLAVRPLTGYELTQQVRRSLRFVWPASEGHLYREQKRLVDVGWATVEREPAGQRSRQRYSITEAGRSALAAWLDSEPEEPHFQIEGVLRVFFGDQGSRDQLVRSMQVSTDKARSMLAEMRGYVDTYLAPGGPLEMLEQGLSGPGQRLDFAGRPVLPERLPVVALAIEVTTQLLETLETFFSEGADVVSAWGDAPAAALAPETRERLERIRSRAPE